MEIEKLQAGPVDFENASEGGSIDHEDQITDSRFGKSPSNGSDGLQNGHSRVNYSKGKELPQNGSTALGNTDVNTDDVSAANNSHTFEYTVTS